MRPLRTRDYLLYQRLQVARADFQQAKFFAGHLLKKGWHFEPAERRWVTYMQQAAYTTALVLAYSRPFTKSRNWPRIPEKLSPYGLEQRALHEKLLKLRNEVYAHSDVGIQDPSPLKILGRGTSTVRKLPSMKLSKEETEAVLEMIRLTTKSIGRRIAQLVASMQNEI